MNLKTLIKALQISGIVFVTDNGEIYNAVQEGIDLTGNFEYLEQILANAPEHFELLAWNERFGFEYTTVEQYRKTYPNHYYRYQDDCISLKYGV